MSTATTTTTAPTTRRRRWPWIVGIAAFLALALIAIGAFVWFNNQPKDGLDPNATKADCSLAEEAAKVAGTPTPFYINSVLKTDVFGPDPVVRDEAALLMANHDDRCIDPSRVSAHAFAWGLIPSDKIDAYTAIFVADHDKWLRAIGQMEQLEKESMDKAAEEQTAFALSAVPAGTSTLWMQPDGKGGVQVRQGTTHTDGTALVFIHPDGRTVKLRVECDFQPVFDVPPPGVPECLNGSCLPCPYDSTLPPDSPDCLQPKDESLSVDSPDGWTQLPAGDLTDGNESEEQLASGDTSGSGLDNQTTGGAAGTDTSDLSSGTTVVIGGTAGGDSSAGITVDGTATSQDEGTDGAGDLGGPPADD